MNKLLILLGFLAVTNGCATTQLNKDQQIKAHRDRLVYLVNDTAQQVGAYVVSITWSPDPTNNVDFATVQLVMPDGTYEVYVFIREGGNWLL